MKVHAQQQGGLAVEVGGVEKFLEVAPNGMVEQMTVTSTKIRMGQTKKSQVPLLASPVEFVLLDATTSKPLALNVSRVCVASTSTYFSTILDHPLERSQSIGRTVPVAFGTPESCFGECA